MRLRKALEYAYTGAGIAAGVCIALITLLILAQIAGRWFGVIIPSTEDFSGYLLAAASFLALAHTYQRGGHIRVTLLLRLLGDTAQRRLMLAALALLAAVLGYAAWYLSLMAYQSWRFGEVSQGYVALPLWIPQTPVALGATLFFTAVADDLLLALRGRMPAFVDREK